LVACKFICGDSALELAKLPADSIDLTVTSPPYDGLRTYNGYSFDFETIAKELYRVTKPGGVVVWVVADATVKGSESGTSFRQALYFKDVCGFNLHDTMIYRKINYIPLTHNRYEQEFEYMFVFSKGKPKTFNAIRVPTKNPGAKHNRTKSNKEEGSAVRNRAEITVTCDDKQKGNVWDMAVSHTRLDHPAMFPEPLEQDHILSWSNEGDTVLDPFSGGGTTGKMAVTNGRNFIGFDISEKYIGLSKQRVNSVTPTQVATPIAPEPATQPAWIQDGDTYAVALSGTDVCRIARKDVNAWELTATLNGQKYRGERTDLAEMFKAADTLLVNYLPEANQCTS
jgi:DNA modification methylase